ncbi:MAG: preprotein translocase subunit SecG [Patescibacteria group bacterium]|nr:preprotein translocase subunit SecG [Patescibacteria group bacterium]
MYLGIAQIIVSIALIVLILLQERSSGLSGIFGGGGDGGGFYQKRRGFEKLIFAATIVLAVAFAVLSLLNLFINR